MENTWDSIDTLNAEKRREVTRFIELNRTADLNDTEAVVRLREILTKIEDLTRRINVMIGRLMESSLSSSNQPRSRTSSMGSPRSQSFS